MKYQEDAARTESLPHMEANSRGVAALRLLHAGIGLATESGEFLDQLKKYVYYGKPLDYINLAEEVGDVLWYCALACNALGVDMQDVMDRNIAKLKERYPDKFTEDNALNRNLDAERAILEA